MVNKRKILINFRVLIIPLVLSSLFLFYQLVDIFINTPISTVSNLGTTSLVEQHFINTINRETNDLLKGEKISGSFKATENNLGMILVKFFNNNRINTDQVKFRLREDESENWLYEGTYKTDQMQPDQYFTFGIPVIQNSISKKYFFEVESLNGSLENSISLSKKYPYSAVVYQFPKDTLSHSLFDLLKFILKKNFYGLSLVNYSKLLTVFAYGFIFSFLFIHHKAIFFQIEAVMKKAYFILKKSNFFKRNKKFKTLLILKKRKNLFLKKKQKLIICISLLFIFFGSLIVRLEFYTNKNNFDDYYFSQLGGAGDYDLLIKESTSYLVQKDYQIQKSLVNDYPILVRLVAIFINMFGFMRGLEYLTYLMIFISSLVCLVPFIIVSKLNKFLLGGFVSSIFLMLNPLSIWLSSDRMVDVVTSFFFSIFTILYIFSLKKKNYLTAALLGFIGFIDGLNRGIMLMNDLPALCFFSGIIIFLNSKFRAKFPFVNIKKRDLIYSIIPLFTFLLFYMAWEVWFFINFHKPWLIFAQHFLGYEYIKYVGNAFKDTPIGSFGFFTSYFQNLIITLNTLLEVLNIPIEYLAVVTLLSINSLNTNKKLRNLIYLAIGSILLLSIAKVHFSSIRNILEFKTMIGIPIQNILNLFIFLIFIIAQLFLLRSELVKWISLFGVYVLILAYGIRTEFTERHFVQLLIPSFVIFGISLGKINQVINQRNKFFQTGVYLTLFIPLFISVYSVASNLGSLINNIGYLNSEVRYLRNAEDILPPDSIILLSAPEMNPFVVYHNVKRAIVYNSFVPDPLLITYEENSKDISFKINNGWTFYPYEVFRDKEKFNNYNFFVLDYKYKDWEKVTNPEYSSHPFIPGGKFTFIRVDLEGGRAVYKIVQKKEND